MLGILGTIRNSTHELPEDGFRLKGSLNLFQCQLHHNTNFLYAYVYLGITLGPP